MGESLRNLHARALLLPLILLGCGDKGTGSGTGSSDVGSGSTSVGTSGSGSVTGTSDSMPTSGSSSASGTTGDAVVPCTVDADCMKVEDCCTCAAIEAGDPPGACKVMCDQSACAAVGLQDTIAQCRSGHCELSSTVECSKPVACDQAPPVCASGMVPSIDGDCYGPCVSYHYCSDTGACKASCGEGWTCVTSQSGAGGGCFPLPTACGGVATCACVDAYWDSACPASCTESEGGLLCVDGGQKGLAFVLPWGTMSLVIEKTKVRRQSWEKVGVQLDVSLTARVPAVEKIVGVEGDEARPLLKGGWPHCIR